MKDDLHIKNSIVIPSNELEITASRAGGPGGQHVNKASTRISVRWNIASSTALTEAQKERVLQKLESQISLGGDLIVHSSAHRSQAQNKKEALERLAQQVRKALHVPKKRMKTKVSKAAKEARLKEKTHRSTIKKMRSKKSFDQ